MFAAPAEGTLKDFMEFAETGFADHEQSPPNQRTHATEHYAELINRNRRYGRFRHASSLPKPTPYSLESDPPESPALEAHLVSRKSNSGSVWFGSSSANGLNVLVACGRHTQWYRRGLLTVSRPKTVRTESV